MGKIGSETLEKKKLHKQSISHSMENILLDVRTASILHLSFKIFAISS